MYHNILVIKYGATGDYIAGAIALVALRRAFPEAKITVLSKCQNEAITPAGSIIDDFWVLEDIKTGKLGYWKLWQKIRRAHFDLVINLRWNSEIISIITALSGAKHTAGISRSWTKRLYTNTVNDIEDFDNRHEYLKNTDPLRALGIPFGFPEAYVHVAADDEIAAAELSGGIKDYIVVSPTASTPLKAWLPERYIELGQYIWRRYKIPMFVSWAGATEQQVAIKVADGIGDGAHLLPAVNIGVLAALLRKARLCICNNSGTLHIAFSQKTPVLCFNTSKGWEPYGPNDVPLSVFHDEAGFNLADTTNEMAAAQLATIQVPDAIAAFDKWMSR